MTVKWLKQWKEILVWTGIALSLLLVCLTATFPFGALQQRLLSEIIRTTGMDVKAGGWKADWPLGIKWQDVTLSKPDGASIQLGFLQTKLSLLKVLTGGLGLDVAIHLDEASPRTGIAKATLAASSFSLGEPVSITGQLQHIDLSRVLSQYVSHGTLSGDFSHRIESGRTAAGPIKGDGTWKADAMDLTVEHIPVGPGRTLALAFAKVSAGVLCRDATCDITELKGEGIDGSFTGEGTITLQQPIQNSQLALTVTIVPGAGFASKAGALGLPALPAGIPLTVKIIGPLAQARIAL